MRANGWSGPRCRRAWDSRMYPTVRCVLGALLIGSSLARAQESGLHEDAAGREEWFWSMRSYPFATRPYDKMARLQQSLLDYLQRTPARAIAGSAPLGGAWRPLGPIGVWYTQIVSGRVAAILPAAIPGGPMYVGTATGGVWRSTMTVSHGHRLLIRSAA